MLEGWDILAQGLQDQTPPVSGKAAANDHVAQAQERPPGAGHRPNSGP